MTSPIEVAARALIPYSGASTNREFQAHVVFVSIDKEELADALVRDLTYSTGMDAEWNDAIARQQAQAVIDWLTRGEKLGGPERQLGADPRD